MGKRVLVLISLEPNAAWIHNKSAITEAHGARDMRVPAQDERCIDVTGSFAYLRLCRWSTSLLCDRFKEVIQVAMKCSVNEQYVALQPQLVWQVCKPFTMGIA
jgi:hypothetical protein